MNKYKVRFDFEDRTSISQYVVSPNPIEAIRTLQMRLDAAGWEFGDLSSISVELYQRNANQPQP